MLGRGWILSKKLDEESCLYWRLQLPFDVTSDFKDTEDEDFGEKAILLSS